MAKRDDAQMSGSVGGAEWEEKSMLQCSAGDRPQLGGVQPLTEGSKSTGWRWSLSGEGGETKMEPFCSIRDGKYEVLPTLCNYVVGILIGRIHRGSAYNIKFYRLSSLFTVSVANLPIFSYDDSQHTKLPATRVYGYAHETLPTVNKRNLSQQSYNQPQWLMVFWGLVGASTKGLVDVSLLGNFLL
ncbi:hypothetical protein ACRALDRAFT_207930 [Sodiomyces alcalophilus JCM 7366]|uniref:uncharacterized protein n=1 Tax=Sodiomyces alcalophilus JCM 7366 TaxID=591952 RepID=UPI0039B3A78C